MEVGIISPIRLLKYSSKTRVRYFISDVLQLSPTYLAFYVESIEQGCTVVLDMRAKGWKRQPPELPLSPLLPETIILPSYMYQSKGTLGIVRKYIAEPNIDKNNLVGCLEGTSTSELRWCRETYRKLGIKKFALPAHCYSFGLPKLQNVDIYIDNWEIPFEVPHKEGILVTSLPVRLGLQGRILSSFKPTPPHLTFLETEDRYPQVVEKNIEELVEYYQHEL